MSRPPRSIVPRSLRLHLDRDTPRYWLGGDGVSTQLFNALSIVFPRGEKMFVDAVRAHKDAVKDPELKQAVRDFIAARTSSSTRGSARSACPSQSSRPRSKSA